MTRLAHDRIFAFEEFDEPVSTTCIQLRCKKHANGDYYVYSGGIIKAFYSAAIDTWATTEYNWHVFHEDEGKKSMLLTVDEQLDYVKRGVVVLAAKKVMA